MDEKDIKVIRDIINDVKSDFIREIENIKTDFKEETKSIKFDIEREFGRYYTDAHGMMDGFRQEFRGNMEKIAKSIEEIVSRLNCLDGKILSQKEINKDFETRLKTIENSIGNVKKTTKNIIYDIIKYGAYPVAVGIIMYIIGSR